MWPVINSIALIGGKFILKNPLQDFLSSLNAIILTNESTEFISGHVIYNPAYTDKFQLKTTKDFVKFRMKKNYGPLWIYLIRKYQLPLLNKYSYMEQNTSVWLEQKYTGKNWSQ